MPTEIAGTTLYSTEELAEIFKVTPKTLRAYITGGKLKGRKIGGKWFVTQEALKEFFGEAEGKAS